MQKWQAIGIFGGTFDPIHNAHLRLAQDLVHELRLDRLFLVPNQMSPLKPAGTFASPKDRLAMLRIAVAESPRLDISDFEMRRPPPSYTVDTLRYFQSLYPMARRYFILGADNLAELHKWKDVEDIFALAELRVLARPGYALSGDGPLEIHLPEKWRQELLRNVLYLRQLDISSRDIRKRVTEGKTLNGLVPESVADYIYSNHLYTGYPSCQQKK